VRRYSQNKLPPRWHQEHNHGAADAALRRLYHCQSSPIVTNRRKSLQIAAAVAIVVVSHLEWHFITTGRLQSACFRRRRPDCRRRPTASSTTSITLSMTSKKPPSPRLLPSLPPTGATVTMRMATKMAEEGMGQKEEEEAFGL